MPTWTSPTRVGWRSLRQPWAPNSYLFPITRSCTAASLPRCGENWKSPSCFDPRGLATMEHNVTGQDYDDRRHFRFSGPIVDIHAHVFQTRPDDPKAGPPLGAGPGASLEQAQTMLEVA